MGSAAVLSDPCALRLCRKHKQAQHEDLPWPVGKAAITSWPSRNSQTILKAKRKLDSLLYSIAVAILTHFTAGHTTPCGCTGSTNTSNEALIRHSSRAVHMPRPIYLTLLSLPSFLFFGGRGSLEGLETRLGIEGTVCRHHVHQNTLMSKYILTRNYSQMPTSMMSI